VSSIAAALHKLDESLEILEIAAEIASANRNEQKVKAVSSQHDLFAGSPVNQNYSNNSNSVVDTSLIARKLDLTISKVEKLLQEG
jgi:hypothetical protein